MAAVLRDPIRTSDALDRLIADALRAQSASASSPAQTLRTLVDAGLDHLPFPAQGATLQRWRALEAVARHDLSLVKWYEGHTDALAILDEIDTRAPREGVVYGVWASEAPSDPITIRPSGIDRIAAGAEVVIDGRKSWCSGADAVDAALMTARDAQGGRHLVELRLASPGITIDRSRWNAVGMQGSGSFEVLCSGVAARVVGRSGAYLERPGFWHGGLGIAACWHGAAAAIGTRVRDLQVGRDDVHALAHLGAIDGVLASSAALLREAAAAIDRDPRRDAMHLALRARGAIADACETVLHHAARAMGPGPLCNDPALAARFADLPVFIRQSRAEHDGVAQSRALLGDADAMQEPGWSL